MKLIENGAVKQPDGIETIIPLDDFLANPDLGRAIEISSDANIEVLAPYVSKLDLIVIGFESFADGRGFSTAHRLRQSLGYSEKIWASGNLIPDQYAMAIQCGIDAILLDEEHLQRQPVEQWRDALVNAPLPYKYEDNISGCDLSDQELKSNRIVHDGTIDFLNARYTGIATEQLLQQVLNDQGLGKTAMVTSFGTESAVLLHMLAKFSADTPVLFIDTGKLFPETLEYQKQLVEYLKLTNVRILRPEQTAVTNTDPEGSLWKIDISSCCGLRKVAPLQSALAGFDNWISGRKSYHGEHRSALQIFERSGNQIKINPLASWSHAELADYIRQHDLPMHPLVKQGYSSVGCAPCTSPVCPGEDVRSGRWSGQSKTECGIHFIDGKVVRQGINN